MGPKQGFEGHLSQSQTSVKQVQFRFLTVKSTALSTACHNNIANFPLQIYPLSLLYPVIITHYTLLLMPQIYFVFFVYIVRMPPYLTCMLCYKHLVAFSMSFWTCKAVLNNWFNFSLKIENLISLTPYFQWCVTLVAVPPNDATEHVNQQ